MVGVLFRFFVFQIFCKPTSQKNCVTGIEGEGKEKKAVCEAREREGSLLLSSQYSCGCFDPFPPFPTACHAG